MITMITHWYGRRRVWAHTWVLNLFKNVHNFFLYRHFSVTDLEMSFKNQKHFVFNTFFFSKQSAVISLILCAVYKMWRKIGNLFGTIRCCDIFLFYFNYSQTISSYFHPSSPLPFAPKWKCVYVNVKSKGRLLTFLSNKNTFLAEWIC